MLSIISNGSKWAGEDPDPIEKLYERLEKFTLREFSSWTYMPASKTHLFHGNFDELSAVFQIETDDIFVIDKLKNLMMKNKGAKQ